MSHPANWYPDPTGRHELRYWDGNAWTDHVSNGGVTGSDPISSGPAPEQSKLDRIDSALTVGDTANPQQIREQLTGSGHRGVGMTAPVAGGGGSIFNEPVLVVNQKAKVIELNNQYAVFDQHGTQLASVDQVGQSTAKKVLRMVASVDQFMTHHLDVTDNNGGVLFTLTRPRKAIKSTVIVTDPSGVELGRIVQKNVIGKINFALESGGQLVGAIKGQNWRAWNFHLHDATGTELARITKTWEGYAKTMFTTADNYVVQFHQRPAEPLNTLMVAAALGIDTALKQDDRGLN